jgi:hypothetical protein
LTFENSECKDGVNNKQLFMALKYPWVPIILEIGNYSKQAPNDSVINLSDFDTIEQLVDLVKFMDDDQYSAYFEWRKTDAFAQQQNWGCSLCQKLNTWALRFPLNNFTNGHNQHRYWDPEIEIFRKSYKDLYNWWMSDESNCNNSWTFD